MKILLDIEIRPAAVTGFIEVVKTTGELVKDASGALAGVENITEEKPIKVKIYA